MMPKETCLKVLLIIMQVNIENIYGLYKKTNKRHYLNHKICPLYGAVWPRGYKTFFFMLNSVEHEILNAREYKDIKKFGLFRFR